MRLPADVCCWRRLGTYGASHAGNQRLDWLKSSGIRWGTTAHPTCHNDKREGKPTDSGQSVKNQRLPFGIYQPQPKVSPRPDIQHTARVERRTTSDYPSINQEKCLALVNHYWQQSHAAPVKLPLTFAERRGYRRGWVNKYTPMRTLQNKLTPMYRNTARLADYIRTHPPTHLTHRTIHRSPVTFQDIQDRQFVLHTIQRYMHFMEDHHVRRLGSFDEAEFLKQIQQWPPTAPWFTEMLTFIITRVAKRTFVKALKELQDFVCQGIRKWRVTDPPCVSAFIPPLLALLKAHAFRKNYVEYEALLQLCMDWELPITESMLSHYVLVLTRAQRYTAVTKLLYHLDPCGTKPTISAVNVWLETLCLQAPTMYVIPYLCALLEKVYPPTDPQGRPLAHRYRVNMATLELLLKRCHSLRHLCSVWRLACVQKVHLPYSSLFSSQSFQIQVLRAAHRVGTHLHIDLSTPLVSSWKTGEIEPDLFDGKNTLRSRTLLLSMANPSRSGSFQRKGFLGTMQFHPWAYYYYVRRIRWTQPIDWTTILVLVQTLPAQHVGQATMALIRVMLGYLGRFYNQDRLKYSQQRLIRVKARDREWRRRITLVTHRLAKLTPLIWSLPSPLSLPTPTNKAGTSPTRSSVASWKSRFQSAAQQPRLSHLTNAPLPTYQSPGTAHLRNTLVEGHELLGRLWYLIVHLYELKYITPTTTGRSPSASSVAKGNTPSTLTYLRDMMNTTSTSTTLGTLGISALNMPLDVPTPETRTAVEDILNHRKTTPLAQNTLITYVRTLGVMGHAVDLAAMVNNLTTIWESPNSSQLGWWSNSPVYRPKVFRSMLVAAWETTYGNDLDFVFEIFHQVYPTYQRHYTERTYPSFTNLPKDVRGGPPKDMTMYPRYPKSCFVRDRESRRRILPPLPDLSLLSETLRPPSLEVQRWVYLSSIDQRDHRELPTYWLLQLAGRSVSRADLRPLAKLTIVKRYIFFITQHQLPFDPDTMWDHLYWLAVNVRTHKSTSVNNPKRSLASDRRGATYNNEPNEEIDSRAEEWADQVVNLLMDVRDSHIDIDLLR
ncbi:hypothetical protein IWQ61_007342 [Dispira simplex]|nr:hypothetical protein IWQ61_007342 [Dispira simplex]